jgi:peptide/nickel transport system substrate-binding protein
MEFDLPQGLATLDPANLTDKGIEIGHLVFDTLSTLAAPPTISADRMRYVFTVKPGVKYADGRRILADDFAYAIERLIDPKLGAAGASVVSDVRSVHTRGENVLEIVLAKPDESFALHFIVPQTAPIPRDFPIDRLRADPPCSGPFRIVEWREGQSLTLARNDNYWNRDLPYLNGIVVRTGVPVDTSVMRFFRGETDVLVEMNSSTFVRLMRTPAWRPLLRHAPALNANGIAINVTRPPLNDIRVRQALNLAVNKDDLILLTHGRYRRSFGPIAPGVQGFDPMAEPWPHDPERARALLRSHNGLKLRYTVPGDAQSLMQAQSIQADLADVGVHIEIEVIADIVLGAVRGRGDFDLITAGWGVDYPDAANFFIPFDSRWIHPTDAFNYGRYRNPTLDALLDQIARESNETRRMALLHHAEQIVHDECPWIWLPSTLYTLARQPNVHVGSFDPIWEFDFRAAWKSQ